MSYQEIKNIVSLLGTLLIFGCYSWFVFLRAPEWTLETTEAFTYWTSAILILIPVAIVAKIAIFIVFSIVYRIIAQVEEPSFADELDKIIQLKSNRVSHYVFVIGFLLGIGSLSLGMPIAAMFAIFFVAGFSSEVAGILTELYLYRRGV